MRVLFVCSRNRKRSPTAEQLFGGRDGLETASAGLADDAEEMVTPDLLEWASLVHRTRLRRRFGKHLGAARIVCLDIKDDYEFMDEALVRLLEARVTPHLQRLTGRKPAAVGSTGLPTAHVRPVTSSSQDVDSLYAICLASGANGSDASDLYLDPRLIGHVYAAPYAVLSPESGFVAEDKAGVAGYVVGAFDTDAFEHRLERDWWPRLRARYPDPSATPWEDWTPDQLRSFMIHHPHPTNPAIVARYPAHVHMNLLPRLQRQGVGSRLLATWLDAARAAGAAAVHCGVNPGNAGGLAFWRAAGFEPLGPAYSSGKRTIWMGRDI